MPNYVKNRLVINGTPEQVKEVFDKFNTHIPAKLHTSYTGSVICKEIDNSNYNVGWFNLKTGMFERRNAEPVLGLPDGWEFEIQQPIDHFPDFNKVKPQPENIFNGDLGREEEEMCKREGRPTWYDWNRENWGTKWNCSECKQESHNTFVFTTAWQGVPNLILEISKAFPELQFEYEFADEDTGSNCASFVVLGGDLTDSYFPESGTKEAYELSFKLRPNIAEEYNLVDGNYEYIDSDED
ncbi:DUF1281 family ferredoxin-like fold protein [Geofilum rhodophaeum]|uniref:DUF1281 family ferredoxin-like fold protein n=1 Tax=Geofilum rhodophaeum TaxID=1965019 RepID=UPI000B526123|nr:hypothetical protein [Geofilum rhodophaeum]